MSNAANPVYANVAFLRIPQFDLRSVTEQAALKEKVEARAREAISAVARIDRVVLDADDGLAIILFGSFSSRRNSLARWSVAILRVQRSWPRPAISPTRAFDSTRSTRRIGSGSALIVGG